MATTSPDNIWTPDATDDYALTADLATTASTVQSAISSVRNPADRNQQFYGPTSSVGTATGMKRGDTYQESDGAMGLQVYNGTAWGYVRNSAEINLVASASQTLNANAFFTSWSAPGSGESINPSGTSFFTYASGVITCVKSGNYRIMARLAVAPAANNAVAVYLLKNGGSGTILAQDTVAATHPTYGTMIKLDVARVTLAAGDTLSIMVAAEASMPHTFGGDSRSGGEFNVVFNGAN